MKLYETDVYGKPRRILEFLAERGPQPSLGVIARAIADTTAETSVYWRALEQKGLVCRADSKGISYALACRLTIVEKSPTQHYRKPDRNNYEHVGDCLSRVMDFLGENHGTEFQCREIAEGAGLEGAISLCNLSETLIRMGRNGLISVRRVSRVTIFYSSADNSGLEDVEDYLRANSDRWHPTGRVIAGAGRPTESVRMLLRVLQYRGAILKEKRNERQCWWKWRGNDE